MHCISRADRLAYWRMILLAMHWQLCPVACQTVFAMRVVRRLLNGNGGGLLSPSDARGRLAAPHTSLSIDIPLSSTGWCSVYSLDIGVPSQIQARRNVYGFMVGGLLMLSCWLSILPGSNDVASDCCGWLTIVSLHCADPGNFSAFFWFTLILILPALALAVWLVVCGRCTCACMDAGYSAAFVISLCAPRL